MPVNDMVSPDSLEKPKRFQISLSRAIILMIGAGMVLGIVIGIAAVFKNINEDELNLYAMLETTALVKQFVRDHPGKWPRSWDDLVTTHPAGFDSPFNFTNLKKRTRIDFSARIEILATQSFEKFGAISAIGSEDWRYSTEPQIELLLEAIRESVKASAAKSP